MSHRGGGGTSMMGNRRESSMSGTTSSSMGAMHDNPISIDNDDDDNNNNNNNLSDDDNAHLELEDQDLENEDPLLLAIDDLEGRVVLALDDLKMHPGVRTQTSAGSPSIHDELATLLRPVLEVAAHTAPSVARTYHRGVGPEGVESSMDDLYERIVSDLVLPVMLQMAQSDTNPAKRGASLEFFRTLWKECHKSGSWLDNTITGPNQGPYGVGGSHHHHASSSNTAQTPAMRVIQQRRQQKRLVREGEILRYWIEASVACLTPGVFTSDESEGAVASRGIIAASATLRPSLSHIAQRIKDADDRGAARMYTPIMRMIEAVLKKLFLGSGESVRSACIKFLEIVIMCCSRRPKEVATRRRGQSTVEGFSLDDLPTGHPIITQEDLEAIAEYAFTTLRGLTLMGGQVKIDVNILSDMMLTSGGGDGSPTAQVVSILKPAALAFLDFESSFPKLENDDALLDFDIDRSSVEFDFLLSQKAYALTINAVSALAVNRPDFFKEAAVVLARRAVKPPIITEGGALNKVGVLAVTSHLKATCLTLLRNALSVTTNASKALFLALKKCSMELQAEKALSMAKEAISLLSAGRAARNRANMYYQWDSSETDRRSTKRQRETDDALAKMRAAKIARGLGNGIQLPTSMADALDLILLNLTHLPNKNPAPGQTSKSRKAPVSLDFVIDAIMTNGASLIQEEGRWYDRDGGASWTVTLKTDHSYELGPKLMEAMYYVNDENIEKLDDKEAENARIQRRKRFSDQCSTAAADSVGRIVSSASYSRSKPVKDLCNQLIARLAFTLENVKPTASLNSSFVHAKSSIESATRKLKDDAIPEFVEKYPLVSSTLSLESTAQQEILDAAIVDTSLSTRILNEALAQSLTSDNFWTYDHCLEVFVSSVVRASELANEKANDSDRKRAAANAASNLQKDFVTLPRLTKNSLVLLCGMCDIEEITKKANEGSRKTSQESIAASAAAHAAKVAAEKRATAVLLILRDIAFQRDNAVIRKSAVQCAVSIASGYLPSSPSIQDKALKLTMNVFFTRNEALSDMVVDAAIEDLERASASAIQQYDTVQLANKEMEGKNENQSKNPLAPKSEEEKKVMDQMRKHAVLTMALCVRRTDLIQKLFTLSCLEKADVLSKAVRANMQKLSKASAALHGASNVAIQVADMTGPKEIAMLLAFLENLVPTDKTLPEQDLIDACFKIQESKMEDNGSRDARFIIPVVSAMKRHELIKRLPEFVAATDGIFLAALVRMGDRVGRQALIFRDEPDEENPSLHGMTLCEQLVFLHKLDFAAAGLPQKRYLGVIKLCLEDDEVYNDRVLMSALDQMSGVFLTGTDKLPLAFMRTCMLVCTKHESLHAWICHVLLPRLVEGSIWNDARQWEGWMRCAHMLELSGNSGVSSIDAIQKLPQEQLLQYRSKWVST